MTYESEVSLKAVCCTCLNTDRKLEKLCRISEGVNLLYLLLSYDPDAYKEIFYKDSTSLHLCWECGAIIRKIRTFQVQASRAMRELNNFTKSSGKYTKPLSNLSTYIQTNQTIIQDTTDFIDCGAYIKMELDPDDIPLSELRNNQNQTPETITKLSGHKNLVHETIKTIHLKNLENESELIDENDSECPNSPIIDYKKAHSPVEDYKKVHITKPIDLKIFENELIDENDSECPNSTIIDYKKAHSPMEDYKKAHKTTTTSIDLKKAKRDQENSPKCYKKKIHNFSGNKKKGKKNVFNEIKLKYPCPECNSCFENKNIRWKHIQKLHREGHQCSVCEKRFALKSNLQRHEKIHSSPPPRQQCPTCHKSIRVDLMPTHSLTHTDRQKYACVSCDKMFVCRDTYHSHLKYSRAHSESDALARNKNIRWKHIQKLHREGHQCSVCEKRFALKSNLQRHEKIHSSPPPRQQCPTCHKSIRVDLMQTHSLTHTDRQKYACVSCDKTFVCRDTYHSHLKYSRAHSESDALARYKCGTCDKRYRSQAELRDHINYQHKGQTVHKCPVCGKGLATKRCIRRHVRRAHEGIKENAKDKICQCCGKAFKDKKSLREHEYIHTGERPLSCELCGQTFRQYASLYSHRKRVHKLIVPQKTVTVLNKD